MFLQANATGPFFSIVSFGLFKASDIISSRWAELGWNRLKSSSATCFGESYVMQQSGSLNSNRDGMLTVFFLDDLARPIDSELCHYTIPIPLLSSKNPIKKFAFLHL